MEKHMALKEVKDAIHKDIKYADNYVVKVKVYDCDETGEQTYDVEAIVYRNGEYHETYVTDTGYEGEEAAAIKRAKAVRTALMKTFDYIEPVSVYTM